MKRLKITKIFSKIFKSESLRYSKNTSKKTFPSKLWSANLQNFISRMNNVLWLFCNKLVLHLQYTSLMVRKSLLTPVYRLPWHWPIWPHNQRDSSLEVISFLLLMANKFHCAISNRTRVGIRNQLLIPVNRWPWHLTPLSIGQIFD